MIEDRPHHRVRLVVCPLCGKDLRQKVPSTHLFAEHESEDISCEAGGKL